MLVVLSLGKQFQIRLHHTHYSGFYLTRCPASRTLSRIIVFVKNCTSLGSLTDTITKSGVDPTRIAAPLIGSRLMISRELVPSPSRCGGVVYSTTSLLS